MARLELCAELLSQDVASSDPNQSVFNTINDGEMNYSDFFRSYILSNKPCLIKGITKGWKCQEDWVFEGSPNFNFLTFKYGEAEIPTANCDKKYYNSHPKDCMKLSDYMEYWKNYKSLGYPATLPCLYLKDWHCFKENPNENFYKVPEYFGSDWLDEFYLSFPQLQDDYRFVYMGPKGTWTPLHKDVFSSFSWSVNICGSKKWIFYPPNQLPYLTDKLGNLAFDIVSDKGTAQFSGLSNAKSYTLHQGPGDAVFVPSGWYHQVWNREDTISVNHNWVNACNIQFMLSNLLAELESVEKELSDCQDSTDWHSDCQRLLKATFGLDLKQFVDFVTHIVERRISCIESSDDLILPSGHYICTNHIKFDLHSARKVLCTLSTKANPFIDKNKVDLWIANINKNLDFG